LGAAKALAQYAAVIGRQFSYELLQAVSQLNGTILQHELGRLVESELVYQHGLPPYATYTFKHTLIQDIAYESLLKSTRQGYHRRIAEALVEQFSHTAETQPELLAHHYTAAGLTGQAVSYWYQAGQRASERSAHVEAIAHLHQGLQLLQTLPETPERTQREIDIHITLGASLIATKGFAAPEVGQTYTRARQLCAYLEDPQQLFSVLRGLCGYYIVRAELQTAHTLGEQLLTLARQAHDPALLLAAYGVLGATLSFLGVPTSALTHLTQGLTLYDPQAHRSYAFLYGQDTGVVCHSRVAWTLWLLGYPEQGRAQNDEALTLAQQIAHPISLSFALVQAAGFHQFRRERRAAQECAAAAISLATAQGFPLWQAAGAILYGWEQTQQGHAQEGIERLRQGLRAWRATGAEFARPYWLALLADAYGIIGRPEAGLPALAEALTLVDTTGERWYDPELYRLKGELLLSWSSDNATEAETCFHQAISIAQNQSAKSWELRAATSLARLWQSQGKRDEARELLEPVYSWFTEGFDTADLKDAKVLLDELA
jgi:predicted ATPase